MLSPGVSKESLGVHREALTHSHSSWLEARCPCVVTLSGPPREQVTSQGSEGASPPSSLPPDSLVPEQGWEGRGQRE